MAVSGAAKTWMCEHNLWSILYIPCRPGPCTLHIQSFPIRSKFHRTVGPVNLKLLSDQKKFHQTVGGQWPILCLWDQKMTKKQNWSKKLQDCRSDVAGYFVGPTSVLPDMSGRSDVIGIYCISISKSEHSYLPQGWLKAQYSSLFTLH